ncbi:hypothetical protein B0H15DRAFT_947537 [Mycena belliarum]|uniref:Uncharacterized protein n=1 Tax=Mycena belliarum TaxID=1033014 RepID=A0AAD6UA22_9AGAR|nr:hypothetical protein B0H15DRAFT_947537 [Mycena belliae]
MAMLPQRADILKLLGAFTSKHHPARAERDVLLNLLRPRLEPRRLEKAFFATMFGAVSIDTFPDAQGMRGQLKQANSEIMDSNTAT